MSTSLNLFHTFSFILFFFFLLAWFFLFLSFFFRVFRYFSYLSGMQRYLSRNGQPGRKSKYSTV